MAGLWFAGGVDEGSEVLVWVRAVATAILAGVIAQILVHPPGALAGGAGLAALWRRRGGVRGVPRDENARSLPVSSAVKSSWSPANGGSADCGAPRNRLVSGHKEKAGEKV